MQLTKLTLFAIFFMLGGLAEAKQCSWVGTHSACRDNEVGSVCALDGVAGVCAITYWDHCDCVKVKAKIKLKKRKHKNKALIKINIFGQKQHTQKKDKKGENLMCSWVGSDSACREVEVGTVCAKEERAGICARDYWDHCKCVLAE